jgi:hypothetical protein
MLRVLLSRRASVSSAVFRSVWAERAHCTISGRQDAPLVDVLLSKHWQFFIKTRADQHLAPFSARQSNAVARKTQSELGQCSVRVRSGQVQSGSVRFSQVQSGSIRFNQVQSGSIRFNQVQSGLRQTAGLITQWPPKTADKRCYRFHSNSDNPRF